MTENYLVMMKEIQAKLSFRSKIFIFILVSMGIQLAFIGANFRSALVETLQHQVGTRALIQAKEIATDPLIIREVEADNAYAVDQIISRLRAQSDASFIVVGDRNAVRLSHPMADRIGQPMVGDDNVDALVYGKSYISLEKGSLGYSIRGKTPIINEQGDIVGVISVGYLIDRLDQWLVEYASPLVIDFLIILIITLVVGWLFASHIKRNMNGKEPEEIAFAYNMRKSILQSVYEGIIAIDKQGHILTVNNTALELMGTQETAAQLKGQRILNYINQGQFLFYTPYDENLKDEIIKINDRAIIANRVAIYDKDVLTGWVFSFRAKQDISSLTKELSQVRQYTDGLRAMRDEYENKISTICGLIEMGDNESALELIYSEKHRKKETISFLRERIHCKQVAGILIGKAARARQMGLHLQFSKHCKLDFLSPTIDTNELCAIIGNLIDNAFEATAKNPESNNTVLLHIADSAKELEIEITDNGCGIDPQLATTMFSKGVTSKDSSANKGVGLYLISRYVNNAGGVIMVDNALPKGTVFSIFIPNKVA